MAIEVYWKRKKIHKLRCRDEETAKSYDSFFTYCNILKNILEYSYIVGGKIWRKKEIKTGCL
jgi:hypothetical protein